MLPNILSFQSFPFLLFYFCLWLPLSSIVSVLPSFFNIEFCFLKQCNNNSNKFTFFSFIFFLFRGDLWDFGYCILCFVIISQKKWKNLRLYQGHETGKKQTKDAANTRVVMNFLSFVCLSQSDSKNPIRFNKTEKTPKNRSRIFSINPIPLQINLDLHKKVLFCYR